MPAFSLLRVFAMAALLLMPLAMAGQGHAAAPTSHHGAAAQEDCHQGSKPDRQEERRQNGLAQCMMACAALPATDTPPQVEAAAPRPALYALPVAAIGGLAPEAATPPPRTA